jgi:phage protein D
VQLNGLALPGVLGADIYSNNHFAADRFQIRLAAQVAPELALHIPDQRIDVQLSVDGLSQDMISGSIDAVSLDPIGGVVSIEGRDLSASLIEAQINETFPNRTSSEIAQLLAARHNLGSLVTPTTTPVGRYYQSEHDRVTLGQFAKTTTEWDLLAFLAAQESFDLYMDGDTLYFGPPAVDVAIVLQTADCIGLEMQHCLPLARPMQLTVKSWSSKSAVANIGTASSAGSGNVWLRELTRPNLSPDDAQKLAQRSLNDLKRHEWIVNVTMPGELALTARSQVSIIGTGTLWDRSYSISKVTRHLDTERGFTQRLALQGIV